MRQATFLTKLFITVLGKQIYRDISTVESRRKRLIIPHKVGRADVILGCGVVRWTLLFSLVPLDLYIFGQRNVYELCQTRICRCKNHPANLPLNELPGFSQTKSLVPPSLYRSL